MNETDVENFPYNSSYYDHIVGSPFTITSQSTSNKLISTYQDILLGGWGLTQNTFMVNHGPTNISSTQPFRMTIYGKDIFNISHVQQLEEESTLAANKNVMIDYFNQEDECIVGSAHSRLRRYC